MRKLWTLSQYWVLVRCSFMYFCLFFLHMLFAQVVWCRGWQLRERIGASGGPAAVRSTSPISDTTTKLRWFHKDVSNCEYIPSQGLTIHQSEDVWGRWYTHSYDDCCTSCGSCFSLDWYYRSDPEWLLWVWLCRCVGQSENLKSTWWWCGLNLLVHGYEH